jgi:hypothetical protein
VLNFDPLPASGAGADSFDLPSLFYLTHQELITSFTSNDPRGRQAAVLFMDVGGRDFSQRIRAKKYQELPIYRYVSAPSSHWWTDLDRYCQVLVNDVIEFTDSLHDALLATAAALQDGG